MSQPQPLAEFIATHTARREVRALARAHPLSTPLEVRLHKPRLLSFERRIETPHEEEHPQCCLLRYPLETLERWRDWAALEHDAPLPLVSRFEPLYDPTDGLKKVQKVFAALGPQALQAHARRQLAEARLQLEDWTRRAAQFDHRSSEQILALVRARTLLRTHLYPALLSLRGLWPESRLGYPELLRTLTLLEAPRAVYALSTLYGFVPEDELRRMLPTTRGLGLGSTEREAKTALEAGYLDGATLYLRDETARRRAEDLSGWTHITPQRRERLSLLLGLERSPLGQVALNVAARVMLEVEGQVGG